MPASTCKQCGASIVYELIECLGSKLDFKPGLCESCEEKIEKAEHDAREEKRVNTLLSRLPLVWDESIGNKNAVLAIGSVVFDHRKPVNVSLWIGGRVRSGKTTGVCAVAEVWARRGGKFIWHACPELLLTYSSLFGESCRMAGEYIKKLSLYDGVLIIDDVGAGVITPRGEEALFELVDTRMLKKYPTWVTSNLKPEGLSDWMKDAIMAERIIGRIKETFKEVVIEKR